MVSIEGGNPVSGECVSCVGGGGLVGDERLGDCWSYLRTSLTQLRNVLGVVRKGTPAIPWTFSTKYSVVNWS